NKCGEKVGELHSKGRFVVGIGSIHKTGIREIFPTPWGKTGTENITGLESFRPKPSPAQKYFQKKQELEEQINHHPQKENLNI
ncbi:9496_t:CDS:2, partial [Ambispora leptoticha]